MGWAQKSTSGNNQALLINKLIPSLWWFMVVATSCCGGASPHWETVQNATKYKDTGCPWRNPVPQCMQPETRAKVHLLAWQRPKAFSQENVLVQVCEYSCMTKPGLEPHRIYVERWQMAVQRFSPFNLIELEKICQGEWGKLPKSRCTKLVETCLRWIDAVTAAKGASKKYRIKWSEYS